MGSSEATLRRGFACIGPDTLRWECETSPIGVSGGHGDTSLR